MGKRVEGFRKKEGKEFRGGRWREKRVLLA